MALQQTTQEMFDKIEEIRNLYKEAGLPQSEIDIIMPQPSFKGEIPKEIERKLLLDGGLTEDEVYKIQNKREVLISIISRHFQTGVLHKEKIEDIVDDIMAEL